MTIYMDICRAQLPSVNEGRFGDAADEMLDSARAKQVGDRAKRLARAMKEG